MTSSRVFIDTNLFIYARGGRFPEKQARARAWLGALAARNLSVVSPQILGEIHNAILRDKLQLDSEEARRRTLALKAWCEGETDLDLIRDAWTLHQQTRFQWWNCVILGSAIRAQCRILLSEDYQHGREIGGTTILDPFKVDPGTVITDH